jgi:hypothetical protein
MARGNGRRTAVIGAILAVLTGVLAGAWHGAARRVGAFVPGQQAPLTKLLSCPAASRVRVAATATVEQTMSGAARINLHQVLEATGVRPAGLAGRLDLSTSGLMASCLGLVGDAVLAASQGSMASGVWRNGTLRAETTEAWPVANMVGVWGEARRLQQEVLQDVTFPVASLLPNGLRVRFAPCGRNGPLTVCSAPDARVTFTLDLRSPPVATGRPAWLDPAPTGWEPGPVDTTTAPASDQRRVLRWDELPLRSAVINAEVPLRGGVIIATALNSSNALTYRGHVDSDAGAVLLAFRLVPLLRVVDTLLLVGAVAVMLFVLRPRGDRSGPRPWRTALGLTGVLLATIVGSRAWICTTFPRASSVTSRRPSGSGILVG